jgi:hypothetical protein
VPNRSGEQGLEARHETPMEMLKEVTALEPHPLEANPKTLTGTLASPIMRNEYFELELYGPRTIPYCS